MRQTIAVLLASCALGTPAGAQQDLQAMMRWGSAKVVYFAVEGVYSRVSEVVNGGVGGFADVTDRVTMTLDWDLPNGQLLRASFQNFPSTVANLRDYEKKCPAPLLKGPYEQATVKSVVMGVSASIDLTIERSFPAAAIGQMCSTNRRTVAARTKVDVVTLFVPSPVLLAMGGPDTADLTVAKDRKSMTYHTKDGWHWTFVPSTTRPAR